MSYIQTFLIVLGIVVAAFIVEYLIQRRQRRDNTRRFRTFDRRQHDLADRLGPSTSQHLTRPLPKTGGDGGLRDADDLRDRSAA